MDTINVAIVVPTNKDKNKQEKDLIEQLKLINGLTYYNQFKGEALLNDFIWILDSIIEYNYYSILPPSTSS